MQFTNKATIFYISNNFSTNHLLHTLITHTHQVGKQFDALVVDTSAPHDPAPVFDTFQGDEFDVCL